MACLSIEPITLACEIHEAEITFPSSHAAHRQKNLQTTDNGNALPCNFSTITFSVEGILTKRVQKVQKFSYLGQIISEDAHCDIEIRTWATVVKRKSMLRERNTLPSPSMNTEMENKDTANRWHTALYGPVTWTLTKQKK